MGIKCLNQSREHHGVNLGDRIGEVIRIRARSNWLHVLLRRRDVADALLFCAKVLAAGVQIYYVLRTQT
jgi:hypothetical protein